MIDKYIFSPYFAAGIITNKKKYLFTHIANNTSPNTVLQGRHFINRIIHSTDYGLLTTDYRCRDTATSKSSPARDDTTQ